MTVQITTFLLDEVFWRVRLLRFVAVIYFIRDSFLFSSVSPTELNTACRRLLIEQSHINVSYVLGSTAKQQRRQQCMCRSVICRKLVCYAICKMLCETSDVGDMRLIQFSTLTAVYVENFVYTHSTTINRRSGRVRKTQQITKDVARAHSTHQPASHRACTHSFTCTRTKAFHV